jgi:2-oxoisovalerate dehydrogenase E1 component
VARPYHSQTGASVFTSVPGLRVICPSTALDANGLLRTAIRCEDRCSSSSTSTSIARPYNKAPKPGPEFHGALRQGAGGREGTDLTVVTYGAVVQRTITAGEAARGRDRPERRGHRPPSLNPVDWETIYASIRKTNRVIVAYEDAMSWGYGAELAARIADVAFPWLDAPVKRVASTDTFVAYAPELEDVILPQVESLKAAMQEILRF